MSNGRYVTCWTISEMATPLHIATDQSEIVTEGTELIMQKGDQRVSEWMVPVGKEGVTLTVPCTCYLNAMTTTSSTTAKQITHIVHCCAASLETRQPQIQKKQTKSAVLSNSTSANQIIDAQYRARGQKCKLGKKQINEQSIIFEIMNIT
jgi:hypothetical protein